jgi:hypothetical protein
MRRQACHPDVILLAGRCHTLCAHPRTVQALAVAGGRIVALGTRRSVLLLRGRGTRVLDLGRAAITPGLTDCHTHFLYWALGRALVIDLSTAPSLDAALAAIRAGAARKRVGEWVVARGFDHNRWGCGFPRAADLDRAVPHRPAIAYSRDGHSAWLNTRAMKRFMLTGHTADPKGGRFLRDAHGALTGIVQEAAIDQLADPLRDLARRNDPRAMRTIARALDDACRNAWSFGITAVHILDDGASLFHMTRRWAEQRRGLRSVHAVSLADLPHATQLGLCSGFGDDWLRLGGVKIFADGALGSQTAYMFTPYPHRGRYCGVPVVAGQELKEVVCDAARRGWAAWIHAIGDRAVHDAVGAIGAARRVEPRPLAHRIEHAQCVRPADVRRMARARIIASVQPCHILGDIAIADRHWPQARRNAYPLRALLDAGIVLAAGSDVPVESIDPRRSLHAATMRTDEGGAPAGGWFPRQRITTHDALRAFTVGAARAAGLPAPAGTLAPGAPADLTVWEQDPLAAPPEALLEVGILGCLVNGQPHLAGDA